MLKLFSYIHRAHVVTTIRDDIDDGSAIIKAVWQSIADEPRAIIEPVFFNDHHQDLMQPSTGVSNLHILSSLARQAVLLAVDNAEFPHLQLLTGLTLPPARLQYHSIIQTPSVTDSEQQLRPVIYPNVFLLPYFPREVSPLLDLRTSQSNTLVVFSVEGASGYLAIPCNQVGLLVGIMRIPEACRTLQNILGRLPCFEGLSGSLCAGTQCATDISAFLSAGPRGDSEVPGSPMQVFPGAVRNIVTWDANGHAIYTLDQGVALLAERVCPSTGPLLFVNVGLDPFSVPRSTPLKNSVTRQLQKATDATKFLAVIGCDGCHFILSVMELSSSHFWIFEGLRLTPADYNPHFECLWARVLDVAPFTTTGPPPRLITRSRRVFEQVERPAVHCGPIAVMALGVAASITSSSDSVLSDLQNRALWRVLLDTSNVSMNIGRLHMGRELAALHERRRDNCPSYARTIAQQKYHQHLTLAGQKQSVVATTTSPSVTCSVCSWCVQ